MDKNEIINSRHDLINMVKNNSPTLGRYEQPKRKKKKFHFLKFSIFDRAII